jgi:hypothetical protein
LAQAEQALGRYQESSLVIDRVRLRTTGFLGYDWVKVQVENRVKMGEVAGALKLVDELVVEGGHGVSKA